LARLQQRRQFPLERYQISNLVVDGRQVLCRQNVDSALLYRHRNLDINMSSTFECSRNDVIANVGVLLAALWVTRFHAVWPDVLVGSIIALLFLRSAIHVLGQAWPQFRSAQPTVAVDLD
jgi:Co/Zn/Cd efflux system component